MLSTHVYEKGLKLAVDNCKSSGVRGDHETYQRNVLLFFKIVRYGQKFGLELTSHEDEFCFRHRGYCTALFVTTRFQEGRIYR